MAGTLRARVSRNQSSDQNIFLSPSGTESRDAMGVGKEGRMLFSLLFIWRLSSYATGSTHKNY